MSYSPILGQEEAIRVLKGAMTSGKPGHAYLFHGMEGVGKTLTARAFAQALNCERRGPEACGECLTCRRAAHGNLRDIEIIEPGSKSGQTIEIDQVRDLISRASTRPTEGRRKVYLLPQAARLSPPAMQTFLKTLEEPPEFVTLILETRDLTALLPTMISRCQTVRFRPLPKLIIEELLREKGVPTSRASVIAAYVQGSAGQALSLASDEGAWSRRDQTLELMARLSRMNRPQTLRAAEELQKIAAIKSTKKRADEASADESTSETEASEGAAESTGEADAPSSGKAVKTGLSDVLRVVSAWYGDLLSLHAESTEAALRNPDREAELNEALRRYSSHRLYDSLDALLRAEYYLNRNANPRLLCENLMLRLCP